ncbi:hypothetical protein QYF61_016684 [Mycteria americana]|uniref:Protein FAM98A n=1 Tax=Mycteria americana TaxID=33587 RepID=A0AAN7SAJ7_MYCAM|nr:hypothetical protein QYF61_016684 [Mycteria americana]
MEFELLESDVLESLEDLGYKGPLLDDGALAQAVSRGASSPEFTKLCAWLVSELRLFCKLEENVQATNSPNEAEEFQLEMSGLLAEMNCPYTSLTSGDVTKRLHNQKNCLLLLTYLISELEAARMLCVNAPPKKAQEGGGSEVFQELKGICIALGMSKPPANITMFQFFSGIEKKLKETLAKVPPNHVGKPLLKKQLGPAHWEKIEAINQAIVNEYEVRRKLLVKRLDVTVQSFGWSDRAKSQTEKLAKVYQPKRALLSTKCTISVANLLAARQDLSKIMRTSSGSIREKTACAINKVPLVTNGWFCYEYLKCLTEEEGPMKLNRHLLRCHHGRKDQRLVHNKAVAEEEEVATTPHMEGEEVMTMGVMTEEEEEAMTHHMEGEEVTNKEAMIEGDEEDVVVMIMEAEEAEEETSFKEAGQMVEVVATRMAATGRATTEMQVFKRVAITVVVAVVATKEEAMVATSHLHIQEVATKGVVAAATSKKTDIKMVGPTVTEGVDVEEGGVAVVVAVAVEVKEEAGGAEVDRTLIKGGSLSSTSSMEVISIINQALDKEDTSRAEAAKKFCFSRAHVIETWFQRPGLIAA